MLQTIKKNIMKNKVKKTTNEKIENILIVVMLLSTLGIMLPIIFKEFNLLSAENSSVMFGVSVVVMILSGFGMSGIKE